MKYDLYIFLRKNHFKSMFCDKLPGLSILTESNSWLKEPNGKYMEIVGVPKKFPTEYYPILQKKIIAYVKTRHYCLLLS